MHTNFKSILCRTMIALRSSTGEIFEVDDEVAFQSQTLKNLFGDDGADTVIPLSKVSGPVLAKVIQYCENHVNENNADELRLWDQDFVDGLNKAMLFDLVVAADHLCIQGLLNLTCDHISHIVDALTPEGISLYYGTREE